MRTHTSPGGRRARALVAAPALGIACLSVAIAPAAARTGSHSGTTSRGVAPRPISEVDCNGWSPKYHAVAALHRSTCVDPRGPRRLNGRWSAPALYNDRGRFVDNGHYVGHDEPSVKFISSAPNSGNTMTYYMRLPRDPSRRPTNDGRVVKYAELSVAPWFGLPICDPRSYPQNPCTPDSDSNSGRLSDPNAAGSAFMELQFYPPGFAPWLDGPSCDATKWCVALNIDSLESQFNFVNLNPNCVEPLNFAYLTTNGKPGGPPGPQTANARTFQPGRHTLFLHSSDVVKVAISDPPAGLTIVVHDLTTGQTGRMTASARNGFMNTDYKTCAGFRHTFHAEYDTAAQQNQVPWAALEGGVLMQQEIGHGEVCASLANRDPFSEPGLITDKKIYDTCVGGTERSPHRRQTGEGGCDPRTGLCKGATTQGSTGPIACPSNNFASGQLCEYADGICLPQGSRTVVVGGHSMRTTAPVNLCSDNRFQNGDLDFDGMSYLKGKWPNGSSDLPTSFRYAGPFDQAGRPYPKVQFETDVPGSEFLCNVFTGNLCTAPPTGAKFYPFWTLTDKKGQDVGHGLFPVGACVWNFGDVIKGVTTATLGKDSQYGAPNLARFGGTTISPVRSNPEIGKGCPALRQPRLSGRARPPGPMASITRVRRAACARYHRGHERRSRCRPPRARQAHA